MARVETRLPLGCRVMGAPPDQALLEVTCLTKSFPLAGGLLSRSRGVVHAVDDVSFTIEEGTTLALVGESGCGKTTTARMILLLDRPTSGTIRFNGVDITRLRRSALKRHKNSVQAVFQDPYSSLNPRMRVGDIVAEPLRIHEGLRGSRLKARVDELFNQVGIRPNLTDSYPHQFSGGQRQRIAVARAISLNPKLIVLDEPVSALDVSIRAQILNLLVDLQEHLGVSYLLISHDLAIVEYMSHTVAVMYAGRIVELATSEILYKNPQHPYTRALMSAVPHPNPDIPLGSIVGGEAVNPTAPPTGCRFHPRCPLAEPAICSASQPELRTTEEQHQVSCFKADPLLD
jgi:oligopeptide/dipeptide ABC transporter ATP-binding protein